MLDFVPLWAWGLILDGFGLLGSWMLSNKSRSGWVVSLFVQALWTVYSIATKQWGFFPGILIQSAINVHGFKKWKTISVEHLLDSEALGQESSKSTPDLEALDARRDEVFLLHLRPHEGVEPSALAND